MGNEIDRKKVTEEFESLQLEETRYRVQQLRGDQQRRLIRARSVETSLSSDRQREHETQSRCTHKKGGRGVEMMFSGNDSNYAVIKHTLPTGETIVACQRCIRLWRKPDAELNQRGASLEDRKTYARQMKDYREALAFPTDNEPSGSQLFMLVRGNPEVALEST
jgi:hypothetical protein